jgi:hypothetical protein
MVALPAFTPEARPVADPIATTVGVLLDHTPPVTALVNVSGAPTHIDDNPEMTDGKAFTVTTRVL